MHDARRTRHDAVDTFKSSRMRTDSVASTSPPDVIDAVKKSRPRPGSGGSDVIPRPRQLQQATDGTDHKRK